MLNIIAIINHNFESKLVLYIFKNKILAYRLFFDIDNSKYTIVHHY